MKSHELTPDKAKKYILGGQGKFTIQGKNTRYTFQMSNPCRFDNKLYHSRFIIRVLTGSNNELDYQYLGFIKNVDQIEMKPGQKGNPNHPAYKALFWYLMQLHRSNFGKANQAHFYHEGCCGRCGRTLTTPESVEAGFGPECIKKV